MRRRVLEEVGLSFLDVISCGFGAIIFLLTIVKIVDPIVLEDRDIDLDGIVEQKQDAYFDILGNIEILRRQIEEENHRLDGELEKLAVAKRDIRDVLGQYEKARETADASRSTEQRLAAAKQTITEEMERLLGQNFERTSDTIGGITVDSEYIIFIIDTSGSMFGNAWPLVVRKLQETLQIYPRIKGIQVMNDMGGYMFNDYAGRWIPDSPGVRNTIVRRLRGWNAFSNSSPVEGIEKAISTFYAPDKKISIYIFGDDFQGGSIEETVDAIDNFNVANEAGDRRVRIHAIGFPVVVGSANSGIKFAALMRELTYRNNGTFVGLSTFK